jgi:hypothetical protein
MSGTASTSDAPPTLHTNGASVPPVPPLHTMFTYSHFKHPFTLIRKLILLAYLPFGIVLVAIRIGNHNLSAPCTFPFFISQMCHKYVSIAIFIVLGIITYLAPNRFFFPVSVTRALATIYGFRIRYRVHEQPSTRSDGSVPPVIISHNDPNALQRVKSSVSLLLSSCCIRSKC